MKEKPSIFMSNVLDRYEPCNEVPTHLIMQMDLVVIMRQRDHTLNLYQ
jgi:hypothetical protein